MKYHFLTDFAVNAKSCVNSNKGKVTGGTPLWHLAPSALLPLRTKSP